MLVFFTAIKIVALLSYLTLALFTLLSKSDRRTRVYFSIYLYGMAFWQFTAIMVNLSQNAEAALFWYKLVFAGTFNWAILFFPFTRAFIGITRQKFLMVLAFISCAALLAGSLMGLPWQGVSVGRGGYWVPVFNAKGLFALVGISAFFFFFGIFNLVRRLRAESSPMQRNRIFYVLLGALSVMIGLTSNLTGLRDYPVDISFNLVSAFIIGYAVVRHRLLDIRFLLARSLLYSLLTSSLVAAYLGIAVGLGSLIQRQIGYTGPAYGIAGIIIVAILFLPLRNMLQNTLDRLFFREKSDYQKATQSFSRDVTSLYDTDRILDLVADTVSRAIKPSGLTISLLDEERKVFSVRKSLGRTAAPAADMALAEHGSLARWLRANGRPVLREEALIDPVMRTVAEENRHLLEAADVSLVAPIMLKNRLMGMLFMGPKRSGTMYNDEDLRFLNTIANQTATAIEKSITFREMERRLSEQTLLFILSERFRSSADFDSVMTSIVQILKSFLTCDYCALVSFEKAGSSKRYSLDAVSDAAAGVACELQARLLAESKSTGEALPIPPEEIDGILARRPDIDTGLRGLIASFVFLPLRGGSDTLGMLILPNRTGGPNVEARELELMRTIRAIISQGIVLYRTIVNLVSVKTYNENILGSLNNMGDTLVILDLAGTIKSVNRATRRRLGYREEELVGRHMREVAGKGEALFTEEGIVGLLAAGSVSNYEMKYRTSDGTEVPMLFSGSVMTGEDGKTREIVGIARDITERLKAEEMSKNMLLIKEIHHRIKNNLQVISSLLYLQSCYVQEEKTREMFRESQNRVRSMALLHEKLYQSNSPAGIAFSEYIRDLMRNLFMSYGEQASAVDLCLEVANITLGMDTAVPCGLIINELVSNSLKHAFSADRSGKVRIVMNPADPPDGMKGGPAEKWFRLTVSDDGKGFPPGLNFRDTESLGLKLVCTLTEQLKGRIELESGRGTRFTILFKEI